MRRSAGESRYTTTRDLTRVSLEKVLRRYLAGYTLLSEFVIEEVERGRAGGGTLKRALGTQAAVFDRLIAAISEEYAREEGTRRGSVEDRRTEQVERLLAGQLVDTAELGYEFEAWHLGAASSGLWAERAIRQLAEVLDVRPLLVRRSESIVWAWFGTRTKFDSKVLEDVASSDLPPTVSLVLGEQGWGLPGWRLTHRQAKAALAVATRRAMPFVRYADVALLASMLQDSLLHSSLRELYLSPLEDSRDGGATSRQTLRAYFLAERNISSAAAALGVNRHTVTRRLRAVEEKLQRPLSRCGVDCEAALLLEELGPPTS
jgi:hypothetical protein